jgi:hypothetical protein
MMRWSHGSTTSARTTSAALCNTCKTCVFNTANDTKRTFVPFAIYIDTK